MKFASDRGMLILGIILIIFGSATLNKLGIFGALIWLAGILLAVISGIHLIANKVKGDK